MLEIYRRIGVPEVWIWKRDEIHPYVLVGDKYEKRERSQFLPGLDLELLCKLSHCKTINEAVARLKRSLAKRR